MVTRTVTIRVNTVNNGRLASLDRNVGSIRNTAALASAQLVGLSRIANAVISAIALQRLAQYNDGWINVQNRIRQVTDDSEELTRVTDNLFQIAQDSRVGLEQVATLYFRISQASERLGVNSEQAAAITESLANSLTASGLTAGEVNSVLLQTSQAFNRGSLSGDEFRTISEALPVILDLVSEELGITRDRINEFSEAGRITGQVLGNALIRNLEDSRRVIENSTVTIDQALTITGNNLTRFIGILGDVTGVSDDVTSAIINIGSAFDDLTTIIQAGAIQNVFSTQFQGIVNDASFFLTALQNQFVEFFGNTTFNAELAGEAISSEFTRFGPNLRFAIQSATVEFAGFIDRLGALRRAIVATFDFTDDISIDQARGTYADEVDAINEVVDETIELFRRQRDEDGERTRAAIEFSNQRIAQIELERSANAARPEGEGGSGGVPPIEGNTLSRRQQDAVDSFRQEVEEQILIAQGGAERQLQIQQDLITQQEANELSRRERRLISLDEERTTLLESINAQQAEELGLLERFESAKEAIIVQSEARIAFIREQAARRQTSVLLSSLGQLGQINRKSQGLQRISIVANTADAVIKSYNNAGGYPFGIIPAAIMAAIGASQLAQVGKSSSSGNVGGAGAGGSTASPGLNLSSITSQSIIPTVESTFRNEVLNELRNRDPDEPISIEFTRRIVTAITDQGGSGSVPTLGSG